MKPRIFSEDNRKAIEMAYAYEETLKEYTHKPRLKYFKHMTTKGLDKGTTTLLNKSAKLADEFSVEYNEFVRSQFYWFDKWFKRAPKIFEMCGENSKFPAKKRLIEYLKLQRSGQVGEISSVVMPSQKLSRKELDRINNNRLEELITAWDFSEEEVIEKFSNASVFDKSWLEKNTIFKKLKKEGKI